MSRLTIISSKDMAKILEKLGFKEVRQKGSHKSFKHEDGRTTVIPFHGEDLGTFKIRKKMSPTDEGDIFCENYFVIERALTCFITNPINQG